MEKAFKFIQSLSPAFIEVFGDPTVRVRNDYVEVAFITSTPICDSSLLMKHSDEFRMYVVNGALHVFYRFYKS